MTTRPVRGRWPICVMCSMHSLMTTMGSGTEGSTRALDCASLPRFQWPGRFHQRISELHVTQNRPAVLTERVDSFLGGRPNRKPHVILLNIIVLRPCGR